VAFVLLLRLGGADQMSAFGQGDGFAARGARVRARFVSMFDRTR